MEKNNPKDNEKKMSVRGMKKTGVVVSNKMRKTAIVEMDIVKYFPKYKRWAKDKSRMAVHIPDGMEVGVGDKVEVGETRKISKTKSGVITEIIKKAEKGE
ncbi:MAG: 30S ribosomal protein S17 [Candidatus ainarchaeum sp.]|nr:30S ribosomal protein S17 [Candidatus ainarchaeum sp.]